MPRSPSFSPRRAADHDLRLRFFNARKEAPFVGHATIAAHAVLLAFGRRALGVLRQQFRDRHRRGPRAGDAAAAGSEPLIEFRQTAPDLDHPLPFKTTLRVAEALRLPATQLHEVMPARIARKGSTRLLVPVGDPRALDTLAPNFDTLISLGNGTRRRWLLRLRAESRSRAADELSTESRMFCPALGIPEDPVSGNAHAMLASYLFELGQFGKHADRLRRLPGPAHEAARARSA